VIGCPTNSAIPASEIQCIPDATTTGCDTNCQCDIVTEGGTAFGCGGRKSQTPLNAMCAPLVNATGGQSVVPPSLFSSLNPSVLGSLVAVLGVPGLAVMALRKKRKDR
jgi:hypothetical protein